MNGIASLEKQLDKLQRQMSKKKVEKSGASKKRKASANGDLAKGLRKARKQRRRAKGAKSRS